jgi:DNA-binding CsgD family transcriptional regulator
MKITQPKGILTKREHEIVQLLVSEMTNQQIATQLHLSINTVETHRKNIMKKLGLNTLLGLYRWAMENQL